MDTLFEEILSWLRGILLCLVLPDPTAVLDENPEKINSYRKLAAITRPDILQILLEQLAASSYLLRDAINKQVFMETILLKAMRAAHAVKVEDLLIRLNEIRRNGELNGIEKIPSLAQVPVSCRPPVMTVPPVPPPAPQLTTPSPVPTAPSVSAAPVPAEPAVAKEPPIPPSPEPSAVPPPAPIAEPSVPAAEPASAPVAEQSVPAIEPVPVPPPAEKMTESGPITEHYDNQSIVENNGNVTETVAEMTESVQTVSGPSDEDLGDESADSVSPEMAEDLPAALEQRNGMSLKERFSAELLWAKLTEMILQLQPSVGSVMSGGVADRIENSMLYVNFDAKDDTMIYQIVSGAKKMLVQELRKLTGDNFADITFGLKEGIRTPAVPKRTLEELKRDVSGNPMVMETADLFSGTIVDVME